MARWMKTNTETKHIYCKRYIALHCLQYSGVCFSSKAGTERRQRERERGRESLCVCEWICVTVWERKREKRTVCVCVCVCVCLHAVFQNTLCIPVLSHPPSLAPLSETPVSLQEACRAIKHQSFSRTMNRFALKNFGEKKPNPQCDFALWI